VIPSGDGSRFPTERKAVDFALSVADGTSGLDLERLRSARERAWGR
jgi:hypothetical protein